MRKIHESVTESRLSEMAQREMTTLDNPGVCLTCGEEADGCEPDAAGYVCEYCDNHSVYGASEAFMRGYYHKDTAP